MIEPEVKAIMSLGRREQQRLLAKSIARLNQTYIVAGNRVSNIVNMAEGISIQQLLDQVNDQLGNLADKTIDVVNQNTSSVIRLGLSSTSASIKIYSDKVLADTVMHRQEFVAISRRLIDASRLTVDGIELSEKIWDLQRVTMTKMRGVIVTDLINQVPVNLTAQKAKKLLLSPNSDMRTKKWRQFFKDNPPGKGVYRSSFKNAQRVLVTESNRFYRLSTLSYAQDKPWVRSVKWNRSSDAPFPCPVCHRLATQDIHELGAGQYLPGNAPSTPHPFCECYITIEPLDELRLENLDVA